MKRYFVTLVKYANRNALQTFSLQFSAHLSR